MHSYFEYDEELLNEPSYSKDIASDQTTLMKISGSSLVAEGKAWTAATLKNSISLWVSIGWSKSSKCLEVEGAVKSKRVVSALLLVSGVAMNLHKV